MANTKKKGSAAKPKKDPKVWRKACGYTRWGNTGPIEPRGQISAPMSMVKLFRKTFAERERRKAITAAVDWACKHRKEALA